MITTMISFPGICSADPPGLREGTGDRIRTVFQVDGSSAQAALDLMLDTKTSIDSSDPGLRGRFEFIVLAKSQTSKKGVYLRIVADANDRRPNFLSMGLRNFPYSVSLGRELLQHMPSEDGWVHTTGNWGVVIDGEHLTEFFDTTGPDKTSSGSIRFQLSHFLKGIFAETTPNVEWNDSVSSICIRKANGTIATLRLRTPDDQLHFGSALSEVSLTSSSGASLCITGFVKKPHLPIRFALTDANSVAKSIKVVDSGEEIYQRFVLPVDTGTSAVTALQIWQRVFPLEGIDLREMRNPPQVDYQYRYQEILAGLVEVWGDRMLTVSTGEVDVGKQALIRMVLSDEMNLAHLNACLALSDGDSPHYTDDTSLVWRGFEVAVGPFLARQLVEKVFFPTIRSNDVPLRTHVSMIRDFGKLGPPPWLPVGTLPSTVPGDQFCRALLKSHWHRELSREDVDACISQFQHQHISVRLAAVEALMLSGHIEKAPRQLMDEWADAYIRKPDLDAIKSWRLHCKLKVLSAHRGGRDFLLEELSSPNQKANVKREIVVVLADRVRASRKLKRYDFISRAEANRLVTAMNATMEKLGDSQAAE